MAVSTANPRDRMRVLLVTETLATGVGRHVTLLLKYLTQNNVDVHLVYSSRRADPKLLQQAIDCGVTVHDLPMNREIGIEDLSAALALRRIVAAHGPFDIVHGHSAKAGGVVRIAKLANTRTVYSPHAFRTMDPELGRASRLIYGSIERFLGTFLSDAIVATSEMERRHALDLGLPARRVHTIVNASDVPPFAERAVARQTMGLSDDQICLCFAGRWGHQKDPALFLSVCEAVNAVNDRVVGVIVVLEEPDPNDPDLHRLQPLTAKGAVKVVQRRAVEVLAGADIFLMTSRYEGMPYILIEAAMAGLPIVSTTVGGASEVVQQGVNGFIVAPKDMPNEFIAKTKLLCGDAELRATFARQSKALSERFLPGEMGKTYVEFYRSLCNGTRPSAGRPHQA